MSELHVPRDHWNLDSMVKYVYDENKLLHILLKFMASESWSIVRNVFEYQSQYLATIHKSKLTFLF